MKEHDSQVLEQLFKLVGYKHPEKFRQTITELANIMVVVLPSLSCRVVEFGPGISPKSLFTLNSLDFQGALTLVDLDKNIFTAQKYVFSQLRPGFTLETDCSNLFDFNPAGYSLILCNHLLDDIIAQRFTKKYHLDYSSIFPDPIKQQHLWTSMEQEGQLALETLQKFSQKLGEVDYGSRVIISNYASNFDLTYDINSRHNFVSHLTATLPPMLKLNGLTAMERLSSLGKATNKSWLVFEKPIPSDS